MPRCRNRLQFQISPAACILAAMLVLILPLRWILAALGAAAVHELSHFAAVKLCGGNIQSFYIGKRGALMRAGAMPRWKTLICVLAGPIGSLLLLLLLQWIPRIAFCGLVHAAYNLVPLYPLDGGRILHCLFGEKTCTVIESIFLGVIFVLAVYLSVFLRLGLFPLVVVFVLWKNRP